jgi:hypothetical protein
MNNDPEASLRDVYARQARSVPPHLSEETWERLALGLAGGPERELAIAHVVRCTECAAVYRGLATLETGARAFDPGAPARPVLRGSDPGLSLRPWGFLGGVAAAAAVVWLLARPAIAPTPAPAGTPAVTRGTEPAVPRALEPVGRLAAAPTAFRWSPLATARAHRLQLLDGSGELLWTSLDVTGTSLAWPSAVAAKPGTYYWQVIAVAPNGRAVDEVTSPMVSFEIRP